MENLGIFWNKDKDRYSSKVRTIAQNSEGHYYCSDYTRKPNRHEKPFVINTHEDVFKLTAPKELARW